MPIISIELPKFIMSETRLYQNTKTGELVEFINLHDKEFAMVRKSSGGIVYVNFNNLVPYDAQKGRMAKVVTPTPEAPEEKVPESVVPIDDTRLNLNFATAEQIAKRLPGVGYATAKKIIELRMSLSGERFNNLKQLENIPRVNWEQLIEDDLIFIS